MGLPGSACKVCDPRILDMLTIRPEPYVHRYELNKSRALLEKLGAEIPNLPYYDPARDEKFPWEDEVAAAIKNLRTNKEAENRRATG
jgi:hypothetical protein